METNISFDNISKICRLCLSERGRKKHTFRTMPSLTLLIMECVSIEVSESDRLPTFICNSCFQQLNKWQKFKKSCEDFNTLLQKFITSSTMDNEKMKREEKDRVPKFETADLCIELADVLIKNESHVSIDENEFDIPLKQKNIDESLEPLGSDSGNSVVSKDDDASDHLETFSDEDLADIYHGPTKDNNSHLETLSECENSSIEYTPDEYVTKKKHFSESCVAQKAKFNTKFIKLKCEFCETTFEEETELQYHLKYEHNVCHKCQKPFADETSYLTHACNPNGYECQDCGKLLASRAAWRSHRNRHTDKFTCSVCGMSQNSRSQLLGHMRKHTGEKPYRCEICDKSFPYMSSLKYHRRTHTGEKPYICDVCGYASQSHSNLLIHKTSHFTEKTHMCEICGKGFNSYPSLQRHMTTHFVTNQFGCEMCGRTFNTKRLLIVHSRIHSDLRPYECTVCNKKFARRSGLREHSITHTGEKKFGCNKCSLRFAYAKTFKRHDCSASTECQ